MSRIPYESTQAPSNVCSAAGIYQCDFKFPLPPSGYRLVIENISGSLRLAPNASAAPVGYLLRLVNGTTFKLWGFTGAQGQSDGVYTWASFNQATPAVVDSTDSLLAVSVNANWGAGAIQYATLTGYLENCAITGCPPVAN